MGKVVKKAIWKGQVNFRGVCLKEAAQAQLSGEYVLYHLFKS